MERAIIHMDETTFYKGRVKHITINDTRGCGYVLGSELSRYPGHRYTKLFFRVPF